MKTKNWMLCFGGLTAGWMMLTNNRELTVNEYKVALGKLPGGFEGFRIALLADLHGRKFGRGYKILVDSVKAANPDIIVFAGDLYSRHEGSFKDKLVLMKGLSQVAPTYYATGNHELYDPASVDWKTERIAGLGVHVLRNRTEELTRGGDSIRISGIEVPLEYYISPDKGYRDLPGLTGKETAELMGECDRRWLNILIAHNPMLLRGYSEWGADLVLSGHVHGGIIRLPLVGGLLSPERRFFPKYSKGIYHMGRTAMAVTVGLGKLRINNPAEVAVLTLTGEKPKEKPGSGREWIIG